MCILSYSVKLVTSIQRHRLQGETHIRSFKVNSSRVSLSENCTPIATASIEKIRDRGEVVTDAEIKYYETDSGQLLFSCGFLFTTITPTRMPCSQTGKLKAQREFTFRQHIEGIVSSISVYVIQHG